MSKLIHYKNYLITVDPTSHYENEPWRQIFDSCGYLPSWVLTERYQERPLKEALELQYGFGPLHELSGVTITEDGIFQYSEWSDSNLFPYLKIQRGDEEFLQYPYGLVCIRQLDGQTFVTHIRID